MSFDEKALAERLSTVETGDLLDRVTVYRGEMEPAAVVLMERELRQRGLSAVQIREHAEASSDVLRRSDGSILRCEFCERPAVSLDWGWHHWFGKVPLFPRKLARCRDHVPVAPEAVEDGESGTST